jgi:diguanylate cyclase (GGDEF)-like protein
MEGSYNVWLVALSIAIAIVASYTALDLANRVSVGASSTRKSWVWLVAGAIAMGTGIWSMHFIGMLALHLPIPVAYDLGTTLLSMAIAVVVSGFALWILRSRALGARNLTVGATLMGIGISTMHYAGMMAMRMSPPLQYDPSLFVLSVLIAIGASFAALWIAFRLRKRHSGTAILAKLASAGVMGTAIAGMHYTGMAAAMIAPGSVCLAASQGGINAMTLAVSIGAISMLILSTTLIISAMDAHVAATNARLAVSLQSANDQLRNIALFDPLTSLPNRLLLDDRMRQAVVQAERTGKMFALMFIDLDRFKPVNDTYGHAVGDALLQAVAGRLTSVLRKGDTVGRIGGDEFLALMHDLSVPQDAAVVGEKVVAQLGTPFSVQGHTLQISCSIGISVYPQDGTDIPTLMANADSAMYTVKAGGRNGYRLFVPGAAPKVSLAP